MAVLIRILFSLSWPVCLSFLFQQLISVTALLFLGHLSKSKSKLLIDAAALGSSCVALGGFTVFIGLSSATETLCSQAYGAGNYRRVGVVLQRSILICYLALFVVASFLLNAESILLILYQSPCVARLAAIYCRYSIIRLAILCVELVVIRYLQAQGVTKPLVGAAAIGNIVNVASLSLLLLVAKMEIQGAALSIAIGMFALATSLILYVKVRGIHKKTWKGWSWECLEEWGPFLWLAIPGIVTIAAEISNFEIGAFVTGSINSTQQAVYIIMFNIAVLSFMVPLSISVAVGIRVGNMLGAGEPDKAKKALLVAVIFALLWSSVMAVVMLSYRNIGELFTSDRDVINLAGQLTYLMAVFLAVDTIQAVLGGVLRGCRKQLATAITNVISFHAVGLPISLTLVYAVDMGALGFWLGATVGSITQLILQLILLMRMDWRLQSYKARINAGVASSNCNSKELSGILIDQDDDEDQTDLLRNQDDSDDQDGNKDQDDLLRNQDDSDDQDGNKDQDDLLRNQDDSDDQDGNEDQDDLLRNQDDSEEHDLLIMRDQDDNEDDLLTDDTETNGEQGDEDNTTRGKNSIKLILKRTPWLIIGLLILITGLLLSQYRIDLPYQPTASCTDQVNATNDEVNFTNHSTTSYSYIHEL